MKIEVAKLKSLRKVPQVLITWGKYADMWDHEIINFTKASKEMTLRVSDLLPNRTKQETGTQIFINLLVFTF